MLYLFIFYWAFATLFCFGALYAPTKIEKGSLVKAFLECLLLGGILFPMFLGKSLHLESYIIWKKEK